MGREYAVAETAGGERILFQTAGFDRGAVTQEIALSDGKRLLIAGEDELALENAELLRRLQEAQESNVAKETFLSNMSHDIRTPMNAIVGMTALAKKHIDEKARVADALGKIEVASAHLLSLINDVLDMSRINAGRMKITKERFFLGDLLHETLVIVQPQAVQRQHRFRFGTGDILYEGLYGDVLRLRQIFVNIINNAVKYTNEGGEIDVTFSQEMAGDRCVLIFRCADNGIGMSEEFVARIFEPFERVSSSTISRIEGTGLGMSIVKKLVEAMDGTVAVESRLGQGTRVTVRIPMAYEQIRVNTDALEDRRVLILEGDETLRAAYARYLGEYGVRFAFAASSGEVVSALADAEFRGDGFDVVILGSEIGEGGSLFDLASYVRKANPQLPILLVSEQDWSRIEYRATRSGVDAFLPAPFFRKSLLNALNDLMSASGRRVSGGAAPDLRDKRILLVEDNYINREIACEVLHMTHAAVDTAENGRLGAEAFLRSDEGFYDLILMDIQMPVMNGYDAARMIRGSGRADAQTVKIYAMTANTFAEDIAKAHEAGMDGHIAKPIDINALMQLLTQNLLGK